MPRLVPAVVMITAAVALPASAQQDAHIVSMPDTLKWAEPAVLPGARLAVVTVLSGVFSIGIGEKFDQSKGQQLPTGGFASIAPDHPHYAWAGAGETVVQVHGVGPTDLQFVNPEDDPRKKWVAR